MKQLGIKYHDPSYMHGLRVTKTGDYYDTGANFYRVTKDLPYTEVNIDKLMVHYKGGSWEEAHHNKINRTQTGKEWLEENSIYWK